MYHQFNIHNSTLCPHCIYVFCIYLRTNSDLCHLQHKATGFYNRDVVFTARYGLDLKTDFRFILISEELLSHISTLPPAVYISLFL